MENSKKILSRAFTVFTVVILVFALNVTGALAGFWRTIDGMTANGVPNPAQFLFGQGTDGTTNGIFGYGYGFGSGDFNAGTVVAPSASSSGGSSSSKNTTSSTSSSSGGTTSSTSSSSGGTTSSGGGLNSWSNSSSEGNSDNAGWSTSGLNVIPTKIPTTGASMR